MTFSPRTTLINPSYGTDPETGAELVSIEQGDQRLVFTKAGLPSFITALYRDALALHRNYESELDMLAQERIRQLRAEVERLRGIVREIPLAHIMDDNSVSTLGEEGTMLLDRLLQLGVDDATLRKLKYLCNRMLGQPYIAAVQTVDEEKIVGFCKYNPPKEDPTP